jgi:hypothetical protein
LASGRMSKLSRTIARTRAWLQRQRRTEPPNAIASARPPWPDLPCAANIISADPLIVFTLTGQDLPLGLGTIFADRYGDYPATFFITPAYTIEEDSITRHTHELAERHRARNRHQSFIFCCNSVGEVELLGRFGEAVHLINQSIVVSDRTFHPIGGAKVEFDAICNASLWPLKRHELAAEIPKVAYVTYYFEGIGTKAEVQPRLNTLRYPPPGHQLINPISDDLPVMLPPAAVNEAYSRATVGLCLSPYEGAMQASLEYLLAGLPVVSTPCRGGRDTFYRPEYCIIAEANPRSIREAVDELQRRAIPREYVRTKTLELVDAQRRELLALFDAILLENRAKVRFGKTWPFYDDRRLGGWRSLSAIAHELDALIDRP